MNTSSRCATGALYRQCCILQSTSQFVVRDRLSVSTSLARPASTHCVARQTTPYSCIVSCVSTAWTIVSSLVASCGSLACLLVLRVAPPSLPPTRERELHDPSPRSIPPSYVRSPTNATAPPRRRARRPHAALYYVVLHSRLEASPRHPHAAYVDSKLSRASIAVLVHSVCGLEASGSISAVSRRPHVQHLRRSRTGARLQRAGSARQCVDVCARACACACACARVRDCLRLRRAGSARRCASAQRGGASPT